MTRKHADPRAHARVSQAVRSGRLIKPNACEACQRDAERLVAHHDDYGKPLDVRWLCDRCHCGWHALNGPGENAVKRSRSDVKLRVPEALHAVLIDEAKRRGLTFNSLVTTILTNRLAENDGA